jgi:hypothetical protein
VLGLPDAWRRPRGRPPASWLQQTDSHCRDLEWEGNLLGGLPREILMDGVGGWVPLRAVSASAPILDLTWGNSEILAASQENNFNIV